MISIRKRIDKACNFPQKHSQPFRLFDSFVQLRGIGIDGYIHRKAFLGFVVRRLFDVRVACTIKITGMVDIIGMIAVAVVASTIARPVVAMKKNLSPFLGTPPTPTQPACIFSAPPPPCHS